MTAPREPHEDDDELYAELVAQAHRDVERDRQDALNEQEWW